MKKGRPLVDGAVYIYIISYEYIRLVRRDIYAEGVREGERESEGEMMSFTHIRGCSSVTLGRVWVSAHGLYILYISIDAHMRLEFTTFKMYVSDIGHYIRGRRRRRRTSVPSRILLKTFFSALFAQLRSNHLPHAHHQSIILPTRSRLTAPTPWTVVHYKSLQHTI